MMTPVFSSVILILMILLRIFILFLKHRIIGLKETYFP